MSYFCEKHKNFQKVKEIVHEPDLKLDLIKVIAILECGCKMWVASAEMSSEWLREQK